MATIDQLVYRRGAEAQQDIEAPRWERLVPPAYQCRVLLIPEREGGYSAHALRLPGVVSQGETIEEALENVVEAFQTALEEYLQDESGRVPWSDVDIERSKGCMERWILVNG